MVTEQRTVPKEYSQEELEVTLQRIRSEARGGPDPWNRIVAFASLGAGMFVLLLLVIPPDALTPPAPLGAPHLVLVVTALTACLLWSLNPKRRYLRFAASMIAMIVLPGSPLWQLALHLLGLPSMPQSIPVVTQVAMVGAVCLCLWLDYRLHCRQAGVVERLEQAAAAREFAINIAADDRRPSIEVVDLIDVYDGNEQKARNNVFLVLVLSFGAAAAFGTYAVTERDQGGDMSAIPVDATRAQMFGTADAAVPTDADVPFTTIDAAAATPTDAANIPIDARERRPRREDAGISVDLDAEIAVDAAVATPLRKPLECREGIAGKSTICLCSPRRGEDHPVELTAVVRLPQAERALPARLTVSCPDGSSQTLSLQVGPNDVANTVSCKNSGNGLTAEVVSNGCRGSCSLLLRCTAYVLVPP